MAEPLALLIAPEEFTCFKGLKVLEKLLVRGHLLPALEIKNILVAAKSFELVRALFVAQIMNIDKAYQFLQEECACLRCFHHDYDIADPLWNKLLNEAVEINCPERVNSLLILHKTLQLFRGKDMVLTAQLAAKLGNAECLRLVLNAWRFERQPSTFERMIESGLDGNDCIQMLNDKDYGEMFGNQYFLSPLYLAAKYGKVECVRMLLRLGFHVDGPRWSMATPLFVACECGHLDVVKLLLEAGADVNGRGVTGRKILHTTLSVGYEECAKELIKAGVLINYQSAGGKTALHIAASDGFEEVAAMLIEHGADLEARDICGWTPLFFAVEADNEALVRLLVAAGADTSKTDENRLTLLELVKSDTIRMLLHK